MTSHPAAANAPMPRRRSTTPKPPAPPPHIFAPLSMLSAGSPGRLGYCPMPLHVSRQELLASFQAAPQFSGIDPQQVLSQQRGALRLILLSENDYYARQCALYLSTLAYQERDPPCVNKKDDFWWQAELDGPNAPDEGESRLPARELRSALAVAFSPALDPSLSHELTPGVSVLSPPQPLRLAELPAPAALICDPDGPVLTPAVLDLLRTVLKGEPGKQPMDLAIALKPGQVEWEAVEELRFTYGFQICRVGLPDLAYLRRVLTLEAEELLLPIDPQTDLDAVITHTQRLRGDKFTELDLQSLVCLALQHQAAPPLTGKDLLYQPYRTQLPARRELEDMVALAPVKEALERLLASSWLDRRRLTEGKQVHPACRNLAFSGPPGTGKSVTARLLARILHEEGCGTGRFVEAGREQLIGSYLGQTSPMVAKLFQQARGGVLFIDEAGSLLTGGEGSDCYAVEAVNALVRHMELSPETIVILATYPEEMEQLLSSNPGLSSRVAQVLDFPGYNDDQLWDILGSLAQKEDYTLPIEARETCLAFFATLRKRKGEDFGNGREARRLFRAAVEELALRVRDCPDAEADLTPIDLNRAALRLLSQPGKRSERTIGF